MSSFPPPPPSPSCPPPPPSPSCPPLPAAASVKQKVVPSNTLRIRNLIEPGRLHPPHRLPQLSTQGESVRDRVEIKPIKPQRRSESYCYVPRNTYGGRCGQSRCCQSGRPSLVVVDLPRFFISLSLGKRVSTESPTSVSRSLKRRRLAPCVPCPRVPGVSQQVRGRVKPH